MADTEMMARTPVVRVACRAMNTRFEAAVWGDDPDRMAIAAEEALREVRRLEEQLSFYREDSDISDINARASREPVTLEPALFELLSLAKRLSEQTAGAFDITVAPLLRAWGFTGGPGGAPKADELAEARAATGMELVELDHTRRTVRFVREGVLLDLGAIGKGYAVEQAAGILLEARVGGALIHGGASSVQAVGGRPDGSPWPVAISNPAASPGAPDEHLSVIPLLDNSLSVSAVHGKFFESGGERYGHVLDPRSGRPAQCAALAAVVCDSATVGDALSTALLVLGEPGLEILANRPGVTGALVLLPGADGVADLVTFGIN